MFLLERIGEANSGAGIPSIPIEGKTSSDVHGSVHHNTNLIEMTNNMQLCRTIYYSIVP
jgi:hypothetical protein